MASGINIEGATSTNPVNVDSNSNLNVNPPVTPGQAGYVAVAGVVSDGTAYPVSAPRQLRRVEATDAYRMRSGVPSQWHFSAFPGSALDSSVWTTVLTTFTAVVNTPGGLTLNNSGLTTANAVARLASYRWFPIYLDAQVRFDCNLFLTATPVTNTTIEWGLFQCLTTAVPLDGVFFRVTGQNQVIGVLSNNSNEITINLGYTVVANTRAEYSIVVDTDAVYYYINQVLAGSIAIPSTGAGAYLLTSNPTQPITFRIYNAATAPIVANKLVILSCSVSGVGGLAGNRPWHHAQCGYGGNSIQQGGVSGAQAMTALYKTEVAPGNSTLSNTTATNATLGGQWAYAAVGTSETDNILYAYQNPAGSATVPGKTLYITGLMLDAIVTVANIATTQTAVLYGVGIGGTATSLLTADGAGTKAARRAYLGLQSWSLTGISATIGSSSIQGPMNIQFAAPLVVNPGEFFHVIIRTILGTATASQVMRGTCLVNGYFE